RVVNHDFRADDLVTLGTTSFGTVVSVNRIAAEADLCVCLGAATFHIMAGFGGGRKSILPGISGEATIRSNHALSLDPKELRSNPLIGNGRTADNPLNLDMIEAAGMMKKLFMVNLVMNAEGRLCAIFSGHYVRSWERACREVERVYQVPVKEKADVIIASCGGYPRDMSLYQGTKSIDNVESALKPGGTLILVIEARDGGGPAEYFGWSRNLRDGSLEKRLREAFTVAGYIFFLNCEQAGRYRIMLLTSIDPAETAPMGIESYSDVSALLAHADLDGKRILVIPNAGSVVPVVREGEK
ncbi:MAG: lactate racemase domain-containing protein, partial [Oscillospiraceae bacterium]|nr:lactate racemase domain-containing protein [Oscillospiraceae bacterium]